jgi:heme/copper-type cytochrome/quinol oxidase subunit 2
MNTLSLILAQQEPALTTANWVILVIIQITLAAALVLMIVKICNMLNPKENEPSKESTCRLISIMTFIAWIVIAMIVWEVTKAQMLGIGVGLI